ncbi:ACP S-malonyltransferase [Ponticaulis sp.]|uniref:ACP S-malonyltransferase n=1 Tax=Ponticaulis sp. TaxID=2020902 RepID=UPI000B72E161|nr:ACP S-malonyltransferase [Ponticaulis sp.]MAI91952.1 [acyl-carrier-protein] S-malonyltransferase [Ponticaulis sp.]OUX96424.1 MAG: [acyl-carrier-protein] S-malonyltransferase [Hyphomonadaceae bacterium TMED5]|tara:strand:+ start:28927 stop:29871 length:945 start_codon:yes stop_codon:yes gene_type:complete
MDHTAFIFPGQGAQFVGMGKELADNFASAKAVFDEVDEALGESFSKLIWEGSEDDLKLTANTQPALMAVSLAVVRALEAEFGVKISDGTYVAGHSLGEYSALAAAGAISVGDAAKVLRFRGESMQKAVPAGEGAMAALLGATSEQAEAACEASGGVCEVANDNAPGQIVLSGAKAAVEKAAEWSKENGIKKAVLLPVSAPFHCSLMQPAADAMAEALASTDLKSPCIPVYANVTAAPVSDPETIRKLLVEQVTARVRWRESVEKMAGEGIVNLIECGAGKVLTVMNRRTVKGLNGVSLGTPADLENFAETQNQA